MKKILLLFAGLILLSGSFLYGGSEYYYDESGTLGSRSATSAETTVQTRDDVWLSPSSIPYIMTAPGTIGELKLDHTTEVLNADRTILISDNPVLFFDCNGTDRNVTLPPEAVNSTDWVFTIVNVSDGAGEDLIIRDDTPTTLKTAGPEDGARVSCDGTTWEVWFDGIYYDGVGGKWGVGTAVPLGIFNIQVSDTGVTPAATADSVFIEKNGWAGMTIACASPSGGIIYFGDLGDADSAGITYYGTGHPSLAERLSFRAGGVSHRMFINGSGNIGLNTVPFAFTTDGNLTDPLAGSIYLLDGDNDGDNDTISLLDGESAGQLLYLIAAADIDANDIVTIGMTHTTCTNCPTIIFNKVGENAHLIWANSTWVVISLQDAL